MWVFHYFATRFFEEILDEFPNFFEGIYLRRQMHHPQGRVKQRLMQKGYCFFSFNLAIYYLNVPHLPRPPYGTTGANLNPV
jgi:hypothetical protein